MAKYTQTSDAKKGGMFTGKSHDEGGIPAIVTDTGQPIEVEGGEAIINKEATKLHCEELSKINQSAGNGVPIPCPDEAEEIAKKFENGGKVTLKDKKKIFDKWRKLVNMTHTELRRYYHSNEGKKSGLSKEEADEQGISSGRESAEWILKMKKTNWKNWSNEMWKWANKQISFISRMRGNKGDLYDEKGKKTRKLMSLLIWGHNPKKYKEPVFDNGGQVENQEIEKQEFKNYIDYDNYYIENHPDLIEDAKSKLNILRKYISFNNVSGNYYWENYNGIISHEKYYNNDQFVMSIKEHWEDENFSSEKIIAKFTLFPDNFSANYSFEIEYIWNEYTGLSKKDYEQKIKEKFELPEVIDVLNKNIFSAVISVEGYELYSEQFNSEKSAEQGIEEIKGITQFQVVEGEVAVGDLINTDKIIKTYKGGGKTDDNELIAVHNLFPSNIIDANKIGGLITPSIAILKPENEFNEFGSITLICNKDLIDPVNKWDVKVFSGDVYSPSVPRKMYYFSKRDAEAFGEAMVKKAYAYQRSLWTKKYTNNSFGGDVAQIVGDYSRWYRDLGKYNSEELQNLYYDDFKVIYLLDIDIKFPIPLKKDAVYLFTSSALQLTPEQEKIAKEFAQKRLENDRVLPENLKDNLYDFLWQVYLDYSKNWRSKANIEIDDFENSQIIAELQADTFRSKFGTKDRFFGAEDVAYKLSQYVFPNYNIDTTALKNSVNKIVKRQEPKYKEWLNDFMNKWQQGTYFIDGKEKRSWTLDNLVDATTGATRGQEDTMTFGLNKARSFGLKQFTSIQDIKSKADKLLNTEEVNAIQKEQKDRFMELAGKFKYAYSSEWSKMDDFGKVIADYLKGRSISSALSKNDFSDPYDYKGTLEQFILEVKNSPVDYFEAKMQRAVKLSEFKYAVVPIKQNENKKTYDEAIKILKDNGIKIFKYSTPEERTELVAEITKKKKLRFEHGGGIFNEIYYKKLALDYYDPSVRETAKKLKEENQEAIDEASTFLANQVSSNDVLISMPSRSGCPTDTKRLAEAIAEKTGAKVFNCLIGKERESVYNLKKSGTDISKFDFDFSVKGNIPKGEKYFIVDNVIGTGTTMKSAMKVVKDNVGENVYPLVYAIDPNNLSKFDNGGLVAKIGDKVYFFDGIRNGEIYVQKAIVEEIDTDFSGNKVYGIVYGNGIRQFIQDKLVFSTEDKAKEYGIKQKNKWLDYTNNKFETGGLFHGSPHKFDKFSNASINTGEGSQAYGWGLYFTSLKDVAQWYAQKLGNVQIKTLQIGDFLIYKNDICVGYDTGKNQTEIRIAEYFAIYESELKYAVLNSQSEEEAENRIRLEIERTLDDFIEEEQGELENDPEYYSNSIKIAEALKNKPVKIEFESNKYIYDVTYNKGNKKPDVWLRWDKPLLEQDIKVQKALSKQFSLASFNEDFATAGDFYQSRVRKYQSDEKASKELLSLGIDGIKFPSESKVEADARGFNYVVFDDSKLSIENISRFDDGGLIAPNGKPSNLTPEQYKLVRTSEFKAWFGDWENDPENASKVVDENGEPLVVYHGSNMSFNEFSNKFNLRMSGFYFSNNTENAKTYGNIITSFFLNIKKPLIIDAKGLSYTEDLSVKVLAKYPNEKEYETNLAIDLDEIVYMTKKGKRANSFIEIKNHEKYDGNIFNNLIDPALSSRKNIIQNTIVAFEPNQIKLADGTNTTFDGNNPNIRFNDGGVVNPDQIVYVAGGKNDEPKEFYQRTYADGQTEMFTVEDYEKNILPTLPKFETSKVDKDIFEAGTLQVRNVGGELTYYKKVNKRWEFLDKYELEELEKGRKHEMEHSQTMRSFMRNDIPKEVIASSIAWEHIQETPDYYDKLEKAIPEKMAKGSVVKDKLNLLTDNIGIDRSEIPLHEESKQIYVGQFKASNKDILEVYVSEVNLSDYHTDWEGRRYLKEEFVRKIVAKNEKAQVTLSFSEKYNKIKIYYLDSSSSKYFHELSKRQKPKGKEIKKYLDLGVQNLSYGTDLLKLLIKQADAKGIEKIVAHDTSAFGSQKFWEKMGFVPDEYREHDYVLILNPEEYAKGNLIKRADGSYSQRGLWDNIRANIGSGKKPTKEMLEQEEKIKSRQKDMFDDGGKTENKMEIETPKGVINNYLDTPVTYRNVKAVRPETFIVSPYDKKFMAICNKFAGSDGLRPVMTGVSFEKNQATVTDAHKLLHVATTKSDFEGIYPTDNTIKYANKDIDFKNEKFPNWRAIIPEDVTSFQVDTMKLYQYIKVAVNYANKTTNAIILKYENNKLGVNGKFLLTCLEALMKIQKCPKIYFHISSPSRAITISYVKNISKDNDTWALVMPVMIDYLVKEIGIFAGEYGAFDVDMGIGLSAYFDLSTNQIYNSDNTIAKYQETYDQGNEMPSGLIAMFNKMIDKKASIPICETLCVSGGEIRSFNFGKKYNESFSVETTNDYNLPNGCYSIVNNGLQFNVGYSVEDFPKHKDRPATNGAKLSMSVNAFKYYFEQTTKHTGDDELRVVLMSVLIQKRGNTIKFVGTDANTLCVFNVSKYASTNQEKDFDLLISNADAINNFMRSVDVSNINIYWNDKYFRIDAGRLQFQSSFIDGKYPNYEAVIPREYLKTLEFNIKDIMTCIKSEEMKQFATTEGEKIKDCSILNVGNKIYAVRSSAQNRENEELDEAEQICSVNINTTNDQGSISLNDSLVLLMPMMFGIENERKIKPTNFYFNIDKLTRAMETLGTDTFKAHYTELNRAYILTSKQMDFDKADLPKEVKQKEVKPKVVYQAKPQPKVVYQAEVKPKADAKKTEIPKATFKIGEKFELPNGEIIEIKRLFEVANHSEKDWVEYLRQGKSMESSAKSLKLFLRRWKAEPTSKTYSKPVETKTKEEKSSQLNVKDIKDALAGAEAYLKYATGTEVSDIIVYIRGLKILLK